MAKLRETNPATSEVDAEIVKAMHDPNIPTFYSNTHVLRMSVDEMLLLCQQGELTVAKVYIPLREAKLIGAELTEMIRQIEVFMGDILSIEEVAAKYRTSTGNGRDG